MNSSISNEAFVLGGGSKSPLWRSIVSDVLGIKLYVTENNDSSFGDCLCAMSACGVFNSLKEAIEKTQKVIDVVYPNMENHQEYLKIFKKYKKIANFIVEFYGE